MHNNPGQEKRHRTGFEPDHGRGEGHHRTENGRVSRTHGGTDAGICLQTGQCIGWKQQECVEGQIKTAFWNCVQLSLVAEATFIYRIYENDTTSFHRCVRIHLCCIPIFATFVSPFTPLNLNKSCSINKTAITA